MALRVGVENPNKILKRRVSAVGGLHCRSMVSLASDVIRSVFNFSSEEQLSQNCYGPGESDCLIKTKQCGGLSRRLHIVISAQCSEC